MPAVINIIQGDIIMSFEFIRKLPTPTDIKRDFPVPERVAELKKERDKEIADVITGRSDKFLAIIGPCSADNEDAVLDYTLRLKKVQEKIADKVLIIPRVYTNKPRTTLAIKVCSTSLTQRKSLTFLLDLLLSEKCT